MIGFTAEYESGEILVDGNEIVEAGWYDVQNLPDLPGKMSIAREIIDWFIHKSRTNF
jgi:NAD+ diphosphatase